MLMICKAEVNFAEYAKNALRADIDGYGESRRSVEKRGVKLPILRVSNGKPSAG